MREQARDDDLRPRWWCRGVHGGGARIVVTSGMAAASIATAMELHDEMCGAWRIKGVFLFCMVLWLTHGERVGYGCDV